MRSILLGLMEADKDLPPAEFSARYSDYYGSVSSTSTVSGSTWNGPICFVCSERFLGACGSDHTKFLNGYKGSHRVNP